MSAARPPNPESPAPTSNPTVRPGRGLALRLITLLMGALLALSILPTAVESAPTPSPSANLDQCSNGPLALVVDPCTWVNGNLNFNQAHYRENESVAYRMKIIDLTPGPTVHSLVIGWDVRNGGKNALDYLTSYDRISESVNPCAGISPCAFGGDLAVPLPAGSPQPQTSFNGLPDAEKMISIYGGTLVDATYLTQGSLSAAQSESTMRIRFTASSATAVIAWGGHISSQYDWGAGNSAISVPGSPYHMRLKSLDGSGGNQDRSLQAKAIVPVAPLGASLTVVKEVTNDDGGTAVPSDFSIHVLFGGNGSDVPGSPQPGDGIGTSYVSLPAGDYSVGEDAAPGYALSISGDCAADGSISLLDGDFKTCFLTNDDQFSHLIVVKHVVNDDGGDEVAGAFEMNVTSGGASSLFAGDENGTDIQLDIGAAYAVSESGPSGYSAGFSANCTSSLGLAPGETRTCTVTNDDVRPVLTVVKHVVNDTGGLQVAGDWTMSVVGGDPDLASFPGDEAGTSVGIDAHAPYAVSESGPGGYDATLSAACESSLGLEPGETATCTITNDDIAPVLTVVKHVVNDDGGDQVASDWTMHIVGAGADPADFPGNESGTDATLLANAHYDVNETGPSGYAADFSADCSGSLLPGGAATCTVVNNDTRPILIVKKHVIRDNGGLEDADDWTMSVTGADPSVASFAGDEDGTEVRIDANAAYAVGESGPGGYAASYSSACSSLDGLKPGETAVCTVTNDDIAPRLTVIKHVVTDSGGDAVAADFLMNVSQAGQDDQLFAGNESGSERSVAANAAYAVSESGPAGYAADYSADCSGTLAPGENRTCTVTNDDIAPRLTVVKLVTNDDGGLAEPGDFDLFIDGDVPVESGVATDVGAGSHTASEGAHAGYAGSFSGDCDENGTVSLALDEDKTCTITNDDIAPRLHVVKVLILDDGGQALVSDFTMRVNASGASPSEFPAELSPGTLVSLDAGPYAVTEDPAPEFSTTYSAGCSGTLALDEEATCTVTNDDASLGTRTQGFWDSHTAFTRSVFASKLGGTMTIGTSGITGHQKVIGSDAKLFGAWESSISKTTTKQTRSAVDQARMILAQQLVTAKLNCAAFGCASGSWALVQAGDLAYGGSSASAMLAASSALDAFNNHGDSAPIPVSLGSPGAATPKLSAALADKVFWNLP